MDAELWMLNYDPFSKKCFWQETLESLENKNKIPQADPKIYLKNQGWQTSMQKAIPKHRPAKNPASQKANKVQQKINTNFKTTTGAL